MQGGSIFIFQIIVMILNCISAGISNLLWFGQEGDYNVIVMDLLGLNLEDLLNQCNKKLSLKTILMLADQLVIK